MTFYEQAGVAIKAPDYDRGGDWRDQALCASSNDPDMWFRNDPLSVMVAKSICEQCPVIKACAKARTKYKYGEGIWAGKKYNYRGREVVDGAA